MPNKSLSQTTNNERREYFRIEDDVLLRFLEIDQSEALANRIPEAFQQTKTPTLMRDLQHIDHENSKFLRNISEEDRDLELYLRSINKKIEAIATLLLETIGPSPEQKKQHIILSEGGIAFHHSQPFNRDTYVVMQLTLTASHITLDLFAKVVDCAESSSDNKIKYRLAFHFVNLSDQDRQLIAKHVMQIQLAKRREETHG